MTDVAPTGIAIRTLERFAQVDVRLDPREVAALERVAAALTAPLPTAPNTVSTATDGEGFVLWLGPDEWLIVGQEGSASVAPAIEAAVRTAAAPAFLTTVDVSANRVVLEVTGRRARELLAFGCAIDLDPGSFGPGRCAQTLLARAGVIVWQTDDAPTYRLLVRPSFVAYVTAWLDDAMVGLD